mmetsp:Transcript_20363/g.63267  ORF Transcript_20363/g.63267 Transcript_20363/m.63267 type:complete len:372 (+) Transcript_20363:869-1984(+)
MLCRDRAADVAAPCMMASMMRAASSLLWTAVRAPSSPEVAKAPGSSLGCSRGASSTERAAFAASGSTCALRPRRSVGNGAIVGNASGDALACREPLRRPPGPCCGSTLETSFVTTTARRAASARSAAAFARSVRRTSARRAARNAFVVARPSGAGSSVGPRLDSGDSCTSSTAKLLDAADTPLGVALLCSASLDASRAAGSMTSLSACRMSWGGTVDVRSGGGIGEASSGDAAPDVVLPAGIDCGFDCCFSGGSSARSLIGVGSSVCAVLRSSSAWFAALRSSSACDKKARNASSLCSGGGVGVAVGNSETASPPPATEACWLADLALSASAAPARSPAAGWRLALPRNVYAAAAALRRWVSSWRFRSSSH